jgi:hypothetical protein
VQFQPELSQALLPFLKEALGIGSLLEPHDDITENGLETLYP